LKIRAIEAEKGPAAALAELGRLELLGARNDPELSLERARLQLATGDEVGCLTTIDGRFLARDALLGAAANALRDVCAGSPAAKAPIEGGGR
jgi:hypothetical protein